MLYLFQNRYSISVLINIEKGKRFQNMIYKNSTTVTGIYLNGQQIANGYKGTIQFFGQTEDDTIEVTVTGDGLITDQLVVGKTYSVTYNLVENTANRVFGGGNYVFAGDDTDIDAIYGDTLAGQYNYYVSEEIQAGNNPINYSGTFTFTAATTSLYGFWCLEQDSLLDWDSGTVTIEEVIQTIPNYLRLTAVEDVSVGFSKNNNSNLLYSTDCTNWSEWNYSSNQYVDLLDGETLYFKGTNNDAPGRFLFSGSGTIEAHGNVQSLLYGDNFENNLSVPVYGFWELFANCTKLTTAPELPATTLGEYSYMSMFEGCMSLTEAPELPATSLARCCYEYMFEGCVSLTKAPELPATTLAELCYHYMFGSCTSLTTAPVLPAENLVTSCYERIFYNCSSLNYVEAMLLSFVNPEDDLEDTFATKNWLYGTTNSRSCKFVMNSAATFDPAEFRGTDWIPSRWTVEILASETPIITVTETSTTFTVTVTTASNLGTITLKVDNVTQTNPYTANKPLYDTDYVIEATNKDPELPAKTITQTVTIYGTKTEDPTITYTQSSQSVEATGNGTVLLYKDNTSVSNPYTFDSSEIGQTFTFTATAQESNKLISNVVSETITPEESTNPVFVKISNASEVNSGACDILVVCDKFGLALDGTNVTARANGISVTIQQDGTIENSSAIANAVLHYNPSTLALTNVNGQYLGGNNSGATWIALSNTQASVNYQIVISNNENKDNRPVVGNNKQTNRALLFNNVNDTETLNSTSYYFRWYTKTQTEWTSEAKTNYWPVYIYKLS